MGAQGVVGRPDGPDSVVPGHGPGTARVPLPWPYLPRTAASASELPVLGTRLVPPRPVVPSISRVRLLDRLDTAVDGPLTCVCAPAGTGKTMLLADWARSGRSRHPVVWLRVDPALGSRRAGQAAGRSPGAQETQGTPGLSVPSSRPHRPAPSVSLWAQILRALCRDAALPAGDQLARLAAGSAGTAGSAGSAGSCPERFRRELVNHLAEMPAPAVLILDDAHLIRDPDDRALLELLAGEGDGRLRLVLAGRSPVLRAHRLRAEGRLTEFGPSDLAFTAQEAAQLLAAHGLPVTDRLATALWRQTEGWAVGLRLAAAGAVERARSADGVRPVSGPRDGWRAGDADEDGEAGLAGAGDRDPAELDPSWGPQAAIAEYLHAEILASYPESTRRFLLRTSVLERISGPLAAAVAAIDIAPEGIAPDGIGAVGPVWRPGAARARRGAVHLLRDFARTGGFLVPLDRLQPGGHPAGDTAGADTADPLPDWYRYNRLLGMILRGLLQRDPDEDPRELNLRAALWFAANDSTSDAARHALRAGDWWYLACLLVDGSALMDILFGRAPELGVLVAALPPGAAGLAPECDLVLAVAHLRSGQLEAGSASILSARARLPAVLSGPGASRRRTLVERIDLVEMYRAELAGQPTEMIAASRRLLRSSATSGSRSSSRPEAAGQPSLPDPPGVPGGSGAADPPAETRKNPPRPGRPADERARAVALCARGRGELWLGRLSTAAGFLQEGAVAARRAGLTGVETSCLGALALQYALRGRLRQAESVLSMVFGDGDPASDHYAPDAGPAAAVPGLAEARVAAAMVWLQRVELAEAERCLRAARRSLTVASPAFLVELVTVCDTRLRLLRGAPDDVRAARRMLAVARPGPMPPLCAAARRAAEADLLVAAGTPEAARRLLLRDSERAADPQVQLALARSALACGDVPAAEETLAPLLRADDGGAGLVAACVLGAVAAARRNDHARAGGLLARAVALAADEGMVAPFTEAGEELLDLMAAHPGLTDGQPAFVAALDRSAAPRLAASLLAVTPRAAAPDDLASPPGPSNGLRPTGLPRPATGSGPVTRGRGSSGGRTVPGAGAEVIVPAPTRPPADRAGEATPGRWPSSAPAAGPHAATPAPAAGAARIASGSPGAAGSRAAGSRAAGPAPAPGLGVGTGSGRGAEIIGRPEEARPGTGGGNPLVLPGGLGTEPAERLSERELAVLSYLPTMLTTAEIAAEMYVSVNTVKTHLKSIYRKLDVARRRDAVHRARALHLL
ncbi:LuxR C-terminal-related transcriptional regulator [Parafrankia sp. FMc2]|uniref:LuxR C-terminal-related transcriptional regulator n=1 Tax=Parafrankia sp. FMc2 TaxID=3233196 RepID=UPI0034D5B717